MSALKTGELRTLVEAVIGVVGGRLPCDSRLAASRLDYAGGEPRQLLGPAAAWALLDAYTPTEGWLCLTDEVVALTGVEAFDRARVPLDGEWVTADGTSVNLRHEGEDRWTAAVLRLVEDADGIVERQRHYLLEPSAAEVTHRVAEEPKRMLQYDVEWTLERDAHGRQVLRPTRCRLAGIVPSPTGHGGQS